MKKLFLTFVMLLAVTGSVNAANFNYIHCNVGGPINEIRFRVTGNADEIANYNHVFLEVRDTSDNIVYVYNKRIYPFYPVIHVANNVVAINYSYKLYTIQGDIYKEGICN